MEQILTTGLVLLEVMVTCPREYSILYGKEHQYHQTEAFERLLLMEWGRSLDMMSSVSLKNVLIPDR